MKLRLWFKILAWWGKQRKATKEVKLKGNHIARFDVAFNKNRRTIRSPFW
jgi:hypothetical protein